MEKYGYCSRGRYGSLVVSALSTLNSGLKGLCTRPSQRRLLLDKTLYPYSASLHPAQCVNRTVQINAGRNPAMN